MAAHGKGTTRLSQILYLWRTVNRFSLGDLARLTGVSKATLMRIEHGHMMDVSTWMKLQAWLFTHVGPAPRTRAETLAAEEKK